MSKYVGWPKRGQWTIDFLSEVLLVKITERDGETGTKRSYVLDGSNWISREVCEGCVIEAMQFDVSTPEKRKLVRELGRCLVDATEGVKDEQ